ncbi:MAG: hypothetical protein AAB508_04050 [Patescibacteria group bacterium]
MIQAKPQSAVQSSPELEAQKIPDASPLHEWDEGDTIQVTKENKDMKKGIVLIFYGCMIIAGVIVGYGLSRNFQTTPVKNNEPGQNANPTLSVKDAQTFKDSAEGMLDAGGFNGEGTHTLVRDGGPSQTAYLMSSVVDLDQFVGKKVKVYGQTIAAKKASWLMDVGKIEIVK